MASKLAYCKTKEFRLEPNPDKQNKTVKVFKKVGNEKMMESDKTRTFMTEDLIPTFLSDKECESNENTEILIGEFTNTEIEGNKILPNRNPHPFYKKEFYSDFIVPEDVNYGIDAIKISGKTVADDAGGKKVSYYGGGKKSRRKSRNSKKSHRKSSKKQRKSRRGGKSRRGRR